MRKFRIVFSFIIAIVLFFAIGCKKEKSESTPPTKIKIAAGVNRSLLDITAVYRGKH